MARSHARFYYQDVVAWVASRLSFTKIPTSLSSLPFRYLVLVLEQRIFLVALREKVGEEI